MNETNFEETTAHVVEEADECIRDHQLTALLVSLGAGLAIGLLLRALQPPPPPPRARLVQLLEELEGRLQDAAAPALRRAGALADEGSSVLQEGLRTGEAGLERLVRDTRQRLKKLFS